MTAFARSKTACLVEPIPTGHSPHFRMHITLSHHSPHRPSAGAHGAGRQVEPIHAGHSPHSHITPHFLNTRIQPLPSISHSIPPDQALKGLGMTAFARSKTRTIHTGHFPHPHSPNPRIRTSHPHLPFTTRPNPPDQALKARDDCLRSLKDRLVERATIVQSRLDEENAALSKRQVGKSTIRNCTMMHYISLYSTVLYYIALYSTTIVQSRLDEMIPALSKRQVG